MNSLNPLADTLTNPGKKLIDIIKQASRDKKYPGLSAPPEGTEARKELLQIHKDFTRTLQCLDALEKPYLCELEIFSKLASIIFQKMVIENAASYVPKAEIEHFNQEINSLSTMSFLRFAILMDRLAILLTHPERRKVLSRITNISYDLYAVYLSSQENKFMNHDDYTELIAATGNRTTRELYSVLSKVQKFPHIVAFPYLFPLSAEELVNSLGLPKGTVLPKFLKNRNIEFDNFRPIALIFAPIKHDLHVKVTPHQFKVHDDQHEGVISAMVSNSKYAHTIEDLNFDGFIQSKKFKEILAYLMQHLRDNSSLYYGMVECIKIMNQEEQDEETRKANSYIALEVLHEDRQDLADRLEWVLNTGFDFCNYHYANPRKNPYHPKFFGPYGVTKSKATLGTMEADNIIYESNNYFHQFHAKFKKQFPKMSKAIRNWRSL